MKRESSVYRETGAASTDLPCDREGERKEREKDRETERKGDTGVTWLQDKLIKVPLTRKELKTPCFHPADSRHKQSITINRILLPYLHISLDLCRPHPPQSSSWSLLFFLCLALFLSAFVFMFSTFFLLKHSGQTQVNKTRAPFGLYSPSSSSRSLSWPWLDKPTLLTPSPLLMWVPGLWVTAWRRHRSVSVSLSILLNRFAIHPCLFTNCFHVDLTTLWTNLHQCAIAISFL